MYRVPSSHNRAFEHEEAAKQLLHSGLDREVRSGVDEEQEMASEIKRFEDGSYVQYVQSIGDRDQRERSFTAYLYNDVNVFLGLEFGLGESVRAIGAQDDLVGRTSTTIPATAQASTVFKKEVLVAPTFKFATLNTHSTWTGVFCQEQEKSLYLQDSGRNIVTTRSCLKHRKSRWSWILPHISYPRKPGLDLCRIS